jgi:hypothetical protein
MNGRHVTGGERRMYTLPCGAVTDRSVEDRGQGPRPRNWSPPLAGVKRFGAALGPAAGAVAGAADGGAMEGEGGRYGARVCWLGTDGRSRGELWGKRLWCGHEGKELGTGACGRFGTHTWTRLQCAGDGGPGAVRYKTVADRWEKRKRGVEKSTDIRCCVAATEKVQNAGGTGGEPDFGPGSTVAHTQERAGDCHAKGANRRLQWGGMKTTQ